MKKIFGFVIIALMLVFAACQTVEGDDVTVNYPNECCGGDTVSATGANFTFNAATIYGEPAWFSIWDVANGYYLMVYDENIFVPQDDIFRSLEPGEYIVQVSGVMGTFYGNEHFVVQEEVVTYVLIDIFEYLMADISMTTNANTPCSTFSTGNEAVFIFDFNNYSNYTLRPTIFGFQINQTGVTIDKAHLYIYTLAGYQETAIPNDTFCDSLGQCYYYYEMALDTMVPVYPGSFNTYMLTLEIPAAQLGATLQAELITLGADDDPNIRYNLYDWPIGCVLTY